MFRAHGQLDAQAVQRVLAGNREAFEPLVRRYERVALGVALAVCRNYHQAEDIVQDAFLRAYRDLGNLQNPARFGPWLVQITRNLAIDQGRRSNVRQAEPLQEWDATTEEDVAQRELHRLLREQVLSLPPDFREAILLHYFGGNNAREIARLLGISHAAASKRIARGRQQLGHLLEERVADAFSRPAERTKSIAGVMAVILLAPQPSRAAAPAAASGMAIGLLAKMIGMLVALLMAGLFWWQAFPALPMEDSVTESAVATQAKAKVPRKVKDSPSPAGSPVNGIAGAVPSAQEQEEPVAAQAVLALEQHPSLSITGRISNPDGQPIKGATVRGYATDGPLVETTSQEDGNYSLEGLAISEYVVRVLAAGYFPEKKDALPGARADFRLSPGGTIFCRFLNAQTARPIPGAVIRVREEEAVSDNNGLATLSPPAVTLIHGGESAKVEARGYLRQEIPMDELFQAIEEEQVISLEPMPIVQGLVVNEKGDPVPDVAIFTLEPNFRREGKTDEAGKFELGSLDAWPSAIYFSCFSLNSGASKQILRNAKDLGVAKQDLPQEVSSSGLHYLVRLPGGAVLRGKVQAPEDFLLHPEDYQGRVYVNYAGSAPMDEILYFRKSAEIDADTGEYLFPLLPGGNFQVTVGYVQREVLHVGRLMDWNVTKSCTIEPGREQVLDFLTQDLIRVEGQVTHPAGLDEMKGMAGILRCTAGGGEMVVSLKIGKDGLFQMQMLPQTGIQWFASGRGANGEIRKLNLAGDISPSSGTMHVTLDLADGEVVKERVPR